MNKKQKFIAILAAFSLNTLAFADDLKACVNKKTGVWRPISGSKACISSENPLSLSATVQGQSDTGGKDTGGKVGSVSIFDANNQFIGYLIDVSAMVSPWNGIDNKTHIAIYNPSIKHMFYISRYFESPERIILPTGFVLDSKGSPEALNFQGFSVYLTPNCSGGELYILDTESYINGSKIQSLPILWGGSERNSFDDTYPNGKYYSLSLKNIQAIDMSNTYYKQGSSCVKTTNESYSAYATDDLVPNIKEVKLPFKLPLSLPLRFE